MIQLRIKGNVIPTPDKLRQKIGILRSSVNRINFGNIFYQQSDTKKIEVENNRNSEITMTIEECPEYIKLEINPETLASGERGEILVTYDSKIKSNYGGSKDIPKINMKMGNQIHKGSFNIVANIVEDFSKLSEQEMDDAPVVFFPKKYIDVGEIEAKEIKNIELEFENHGKNKLLIRHIEVNNTSFFLTEYDKVVEPGGKGKLIVNTNPEYKGSKLNTSVNVITNDPKNSLTILRLYGTKYISKRSLKESKNLHIKSKNVKAHEVNKLMKEYKKTDKLVIIDVRTPKEYENGCISGALNFNIEDKNFIKIIKLLDKSKMYLVYCKSGIRSKEAITVMNKLGFKNIYHMFEGMDGWKDNRLEVSDPGK
jgi:rhodanese-related sulfurtransferase